VAGALAARAVLRERFARDDLPVDEPVRAAELRDDA
jgi:hypothetical protein